MLRDTSAASTSSRSTGSAACATPLQTIEASIAKAAAAVFMRAPLPVLGEHKPAAGTRESPTPNGVGHHIQGRPREPDAPVAAPPDDRDRAARNPRGHA